MRSDDVHVRAEAIADSTARRAGTPSMRMMTASRIWEHKKFVTTAVVPKEKLQTMDFSTEEMAGMGRTILGSLQAMYGTRKNR